MNWSKAASGVFRVTEMPLAFTRQDGTALVMEARSHPKRRARICAHAGDDEPVQEMLICLLAGGYVRPHRHRQPESVHCIEGTFDLVLFDEAGRVSRVLSCGPQAGETLYVRLAPTQFHTLLVRSEHVLFHETIEGPFRRQNTEFADWAPPEDDSPAAARYLETLETALSALRAGRAEAP